jgi:hypothetical protein
MNNIDIPAKMSYSDPWVSDPLARFHFDDVTENRYTVRIINRWFSLKGGRYPGRQFLR